MFPQIAPPLMTVRRPIEQIGTDAVGLLFERIADPGTAPAHVVLRSSTELSC